MYFVIPLVTFSCGNHAHGGISFLNKQADLTNQRGIHLTVYATGCIYSYDEKHPIGGPGFLEDDAPNFTGSFYSTTKGMVEQVRRASLERLAA